MKCPTVLHIYDSTGIFCDRNVIKIFKVDSENNSHKNIHYKHSKSIFFIKNVSR